MYRNKIEETSVSTGDIITGAGATTGNGTFATAFDIGDLVSYLITDSAGDEFGGIGERTGANATTRNDNYNKISGVEDNAPSSNVALTAGTSTITCAKLASDMSPVRVSQFSARASNQWVSDAFEPYGTIQTRSGTTNRMYLLPFVLTAKTTLSGLGIDVATLAVTNGDIELGIYKQEADNSFTLVDKTSVIDVSTATGSIGKLTASFVGSDITINSHDLYWLAVGMDGDPVFNGMNWLNKTGHPYAGYIDEYRIAGVFQDGAWSGGIPSTVATPDHNNSLSGGSFPRIFGVQA